MISLHADIHLIFLLTLTVVALVGFALERIPHETTALGIIAILLLWFQIAPITNAAGDPRLTPADLLGGFSNPALIAVVALMIIGQAMINTDAMAIVADRLIRLARRRPMLAVSSALTAVLMISGFLNNTPLVILFIPVLQTLSAHVDMPTGRVLMPLSFVAMLGGMTTLIGSSTNLLVSSTLIDLGQDGLSFFAISPLGTILAATGLIYVVALMPRLLPKTRGGASSMLAGEGRQFVAEIAIDEANPIVGAKPVHGMFRQLGDATVRLIQRGDTLLLPPFEDYVASPGDVLIVAATRQAILDLVAKHRAIRLRNAGEARDSGETAGNQILTELLVPPASRLIDMALDQIDFQRRFGCHLLGIQRRTRMIRGRIGSIRLQSGDVLLVAGAEARMRARRDVRDVVQIENSERLVPSPEKAPLATATFLCVVGSAACGIFPIEVSALVGVALLLISGCLNIRQATRAIDRQLVLLVAATLALSKAMSETGAAQRIAEGLLNLVPFDDTLITLSLFFLIVALLTNVLSNNACAVLFTPIALSIGQDLNVSAEAMAVTVVLAANCAFASPIGYQTNLLVMGPGHYRFRDFLRAGAPLIFVLWLAYVLAFPILYDVG